MLPASFYDMNTVHPRWRGEHVPLQLQVLEPDGSSPLARGTRDRGADQQRQNRFIPAGAGNTTRCTRGPGRHAVHPRWRGEHLKTQYRDMASERFIPAGAGNTSARCRYCASAAVHPRWRGEHTVTLCRCCTSAGSSPLARGTHHLAARRHPLSRFIPAGAGNTETGSTPHLSKAVHPRWRGEHPIALFKVEIVAGSSPLARGTLRSFAIHGRLRRFIPAGAGNTPAAPLRPERQTVHPRWRGEHGLPRVP